MEDTKRYYLETSYDKDGYTHAAVMERKNAFTEGTEIEFFRYEWKACKRIDELIKRAHINGEEVIYNRKICDYNYKRIV